VKRRGQETVRARIRPFFEFDLFQDTPANLFSLDALQTARCTVLDLHGLSHLEALQNCAGAFVIRKIYRDMFGWGDTDGLRLLFVLDEAHRLSRDPTIPKLMQEGR
jgi:DNA phosphorothioation-dependent restriction protein DptH